MHLWSYERCREAAGNAAPRAAEAFARIAQIRRGLICVSAALAVLLALLIALTVMHGGEKTWDEVATHETREFALTADDCVEYSIDMTEGDYVKSMLVMPSKSFTLETDADGERREETYYVFLDNSGAEGIFRFADGLSEPVQEWLNAWENIDDETPEPVEIFGVRGVMSVSAADDGMQRLAADYDGRSFIDAGSVTVAREVPIDGAEEEVLRLEEEKERYEARRQRCFTGMCVVFALFAAAAAAAFIGRRMYDNARRAFMAEIGPRE